MEKKRYVGGALLLVFGVYPCLFGAYNLHCLLSKIPGVVWDPFRLLGGVLSNRSAGMIFGLLMLLNLAFTAFAMVSSSTIHYQTGEVEILPGIKTPRPCANNLHGSARWLVEKEKARAFCALKIDGDDRIRRLAQAGYDDLKAGFAEETMEILEEGAPILRAGGVVVGQSEDGGTVYIVGEDTHTYTIGATRSNKSRAVVLPSICVTAMAGESMVISDVKMELYLYTAVFLRRLGYTVIPLDFENPAKSVRYNFMQIIIDRLAGNDVAGAKTAVNELVEALTGKQTHGERIWEEGEKSILACCIMAVAYDNRDEIRLQNLTNVYHFIANMCAPVAGKDVIPLQEYLKGCPEDHPAKSLAGISNVAHVRTRSSFYAAALATLRLFEDYSIADMTRTTEFDIYATGERKQAIFIILPDEKPVYYTIASLFVSQHYQTLVAQAKRNGGRLKRRVEFFLDEIGNFAPIPYFEKLLSVGAGRGIRYHLFLQNPRQLDEVYNQNISTIIRYNCETMLYLYSDDKDTVEEISARLGSYTTKSPSLSAPIQGAGAGSAGYSYMARPLLTPDELKRITRPYQLVLSRKRPALMYAPDISCTIFNHMLGLGDPDYNIQVSKIRNDRRTVRAIGAPVIWKPWEAPPKIDDPHDPDDMDGPEEDDNPIQPYIYI